MNGMHPIDQNRTLSYKSKLRPELGLESKAESSTLFFFPLNVYSVMHCAHIMNVNGNSRIKPWSVHSEDNPDDLTDSHHKGEFGQNTEKNLFSNAVEGDRKITSKLDYLISVMVRVTRLFTSGLAMEMIEL